MADVQLAVHDVHAWYGESHVLHGITFDVKAGEVVTLLGRNGAGKTTTMRSIMGLLANRKGSIILDGQELIRLKSNRIARQGIAYCPEERGIFASLNVRAKLLLLDEPTEGLAPVIVQHIGNTIRMLRQQGFTILLVEQNFRFAATVADRHYVVEHGKVIDMIPNAAIEANREKLKSYLGV